MSRGRPGIEASTNIDSVKWKVKEPKKHTEGNTWRRTILNMVGGVKVLV